MVIELSSGSASSNTTAGAPTGSHAWTAGSGTTAIVVRVASQVEFPTYGKPTGMWWSGSWGREALTMSQESVDIGDGVATTIWTKFSPTTGTGTLEIAYAGTMHYRMYHTNYKNAVGISDQDYTSTNSNTMFVNLESAVTTNDLLVGLGVAVGLGTPAGFSGSAVGATEEWNTNSTSLTYKMSIAFNKQYAGASDKRLDWGLASSVNIKAVAIALTNVVPSPTPSATPSRTPSITPSKTPSVTKTPTITPTRTPSPTSGGGGFTFNFGIRRKSNEPWPTPSASKLFAFVPPTPSRSMMFSPSASSILY